MKYICQLSNYIELYSHQTRVSSLNIHSVSIDHPDLLPPAAPAAGLIVVLIDVPPVLLNTDPEEEVPLLAALERAGDDAVAALREAESLGDFTKVHKGFVSHKL